MFTRAFWRQAIERAVKSAAIAGGGIVSASRADWLTFDWGRLGWALVFGALTSVFLSLGSEPFGPGESPSAV